MIRIKKIQSEYRVYSGSKLIGNVRKFCCGIDFRIKGKPNALFSIMPAKEYNDVSLLESIEAIMKMKIPNKSFHWNFSHKLLSDEKIFKSYKENLLKIK